MQVAVMRKRGIASAAGSAVTLGNGKKIYETVEKPFSLSLSIRVAIVTFGAADLNERTLGGGRQSLCAEAG